MISHTKIVELFGLPRTGKTTSIKVIQKLLIDSGIKTEFVIERASICPIKNKIHPLFNLWTTVSLFKEYVESCDRGIEVLLADRGILDSMIWISYFNKDNLYNEEIQCFQKLINNNMLFDNYLVGYFFKAKIDSILKIEYGNQLRKHEGRIINRKVLEGYLQVFSEIRNQFNYYSDVVEIDIENLNLSNITKLIFDDLITRIKY